MKKVILIVIFHVLFLERTGKTNPNKDGEKPCESRAEVKKNGLLRKYGEEI